MIYAMSVLKGGEIMTAHNRIKELRNEKGLSQKEFAKAFSDFVKNDKTIKSVSYATISRWERGENEPKLQTWRKLADFFNVSVSYLQGMSKIKSPDFFADVDKMSHFITKESINRYKHGFNDPSPDNELLSWGKENNMRAFDMAFKAFVNRLYCDGDMIQDYKTMASNLNDDKDMGAISEITSYIFQLALKAYSGDKRAKEYYDKIYKILYEGYFEIDFDEL